MLVDSQATSHFVLLLGIPEKYRREELIALFRDVVSLDSFKMLRHLDAKTQRHTKLGIVQVHSVFDISRMVSRYLGDRDGSMENLVLKGDLRFVESLVARPTSLKISFSAADEAEAKSILATALSGCGELSETSTEYEEDQVVCSFEVSSAFSMSSVCTGQSFSAQGVEFHVEFEEESLCDREFKELLLRAQLDLNRLQHYQQGLGLQANDSLRELSVWQSRVTLIKDIVSELFQPRAADAQTLWLEADTDQLSALFDEEDAEELEEEGPDPLRQATSPFSFFSARSCEQFFEAKSFAMHTGSAKPSNGQESPALAASLAESTGPAYIMSVARLPPTATDCQNDESVFVSVEDRIIELISKLQSLGSKIDRGFFEAVYRKIDPATEDSEFLRAGLKILKTKMRKLRRKEKRRLSKKAARGEPVADSSEDEDSEEPRTAAAATNKPAAVPTRTTSDPEPSAPKQQLKVVTHCPTVPSRLLRASPPEWVQFVSNLTQVDGSPPAAKLKLDNKQTCRQQTTASAATAVPQAPHQQPNEHDTSWLGHLKTLRGRRHLPPKGWPASVPENLRLNRALQVRDRHQLGLRTTAASPLRISATLHLNFQLTRASCN